MAASAFVKIERETKASDGANEPLDRAKPAGSRANSGGFGRGKGCLQIYGLDV
jgi:hypothetical protein